MFHIGIVGGGNISDTHARAVQATSDAELSAIYGQNLEKAHHLSKLYGGAVYDDFEAFIRHRPLDMVMIGSPSGLHGQHGIAAAQHGIHVLVEKPIEITLERADALISACEKANVKLGVCFQDRFKPGIGQLKKIIETGRLGDLILASAKVKWYRPHEYYSNSRWRGTWNLDGGGALMNQGIHTVDLLLWLLGDVKSVSGRAVTAYHTIEVEDTVVAVLEFSSGVLCTLEASTAAYPGYPRRLELTGTEGTIILEDDRIISADLRSPLPSFHQEKQKPPDENRASPVVSDAQWHQRVLESFLQAIKTNAKPTCDGYEGRRSVALVRAIYESSQTGKVASV